MKLDSAKARLGVGFLILALVVAAGSAWLIHQNNKPYKVRQVGETSLYVPTRFLGPKPDGLVEMMREYVDSLSETHRFQALVGDFVPAEMPLTSREAESSLIWTVAPAAAGTTTGMPADDLRLLKTITEGNGPETETSEDGLVKIYRYEGDRDAFSFSNIMEGADTQSANNWIAHCVRFKALRAGQSWGRCSRQIHVAGMTVSMHFDGLLVGKTGLLSQAIEQHLTHWLEQP